MSKDSETSSFNTYRKGCSTRLPSRCITADSKVSFWRVQRDNKGQFALSRLRLKGQAAPTIWNAVLAA
jgi:hypothetical protein